jgi:ABC-type transport system substrate-binding protein
MVLKGWIYATPSSVGYTPDLDPFPFDPDKARELLADAGYPGGEGFGKLIVNTWVSQAFPLLPESAQVAADFWNKELGLDVEVKVGDEANIRKLRQTDALYGQITWRENEASIDGLASVIGDTNRPLDENRYKNHDRAELYELNAQAASVFDPVEREKAVNNLYRTLWEEAYDMSVGYVNIPWGVGPDVLTWEPYPVTDYLSAPHTITLK